ncbi:MAG: ECF-type sigma factor [Myxococcota bacterium]|nr:ECF-type sigma factor [Myxococcota bacterium]
MREELRARVTQALEELPEDPEAARRAAEDLLPEVYEELRRIAGGMLRRERAGHTLDATGLVHEAYMRLADQQRVQWQGRTHFLAVGAQAMRRLLINHAVARKRQKRGGEWQRVTLTGTPGGGLATDLDPEELLTLNTALEALAELSDRQAKVVECRYFAGMTADETAAALGVSKRTVEGDWTFARAWLKRELSGAAD